MARGTLGEARSLRESDLPDRVLVERVRVVLAGDILAAEQDGVFDAVRAVRGVRYVENQLRGYRTPEGISSLQSG